MEFLCPTTSVETIVNEQMETRNIFGYAEFFLCKFSSKWETRVLCPSIDTDHLKF